MDSISTCNSDVQEHNTVALVGLILNVKSSIYIHHNLAKLGYVICLKRHAQLHVQKLVQDFISDCVLNIKTVTLYFSFHVRELFVVTEQC